MKKEIINRITIMLNNFDIDTLSAIEHALTGLSCSHRVRKRHKMSL